jgi:hypothetical protein
MNFRRPEAYFARGALGACGGAGGNGNGGSSNGGGGAAAMYLIGGTVSGVSTGVGVTLLDDGGEAVTVDVDGSFTFPTALAGGAGCARQPVGVLRLERQPRLPAARLSGRSAD